MINLYQVFGPINPPDHITKYGLLENQGLTKFLSNIIRLITILAGIWAFINLILAGFGYVTSQGNPEKTKSALDKIWNSIIGLIIIAGSFTLAAIFGKILFGSYDAILSPKLYGPPEPPS